MKHAWAFPAPGAQPVVREESSAQPNIKVVYFENTGHLIHRVAFEQYQQKEWTRARPCPFLLLINLLTRLHLTQTPLLFLLRQQLLQLLGLHFTARAW